MRRAAAALAPLLIVVLALTGCGRIKSAQTIDLTLTQAGSPASGIDVWIYIPSPSVDPSCDGRAIRFLDGENHRVSDSRGRIVWRREIAVTSGRRGFRKEENHLTVCAKVGDQRRVLMRSFDSDPHRRVEMTCDLGLPPATRDHGTGACVSRIPWQLDEALRYPNIGLALLLLLRISFGRRQVSAVVGVGMAASFLGVALGAALYRFPLVSHAYSAIYLVGVVVLHVILIRAPRRTRGD